jgi:hypothetical protein
MGPAAETKPKPSPTPLGLLSRDGRDEMNLVEFPITLLTDRVPKDQKEAVYQDEIYDERTGLTLTRKLTIQAGNCGLTTAIDDEVILALIQLTKRNNNFTNRKVDFSRLELIKALNWPNTGQSYDRIKTSLDRWTSVFLQYENAWRDNRTKTWKTIGFHIIDKYELNDSRTTGEQLDLIPSYIVWGEDIFESFQAGYLKPLDYDLCMGLSNSTAKRMYRFLDKRFYHKPDLTFDLKELAHEHIGLGRHYEGPAHLKRNLIPAITELEKVGVLEPLSEAERFPKDGKNWKVRLIQKSGTVTTLPALSSDSAPLPFLATDLIARGVTKSTAIELVQKYPAEAIQAKIDVFDFLKEKADKRVAKSPAGYLVKSITDDYTTPEGFIPKAERDRLAEVAQQQKQAEAHKARRKRQEELREREEAKLIAAYRKSLSPEQFAQLEADTLAHASAEEKQSLAEPALTRFRATLIHKMMDAHIVSLLRANGTLPPVAE